MVGEVDAGGDDRAGGEDLPLDLQRPLHLPRDQRDYGMDAGMVQIAAETC